MISALTRRVKETASQYALWLVVKKWFDLTEMTYRVVQKAVSWSIVLSTVVCEDHFVDLDTVYVFDNYLGVFGGGTHLAMPKTRLRAGLIIIEAWFRGY